jgi:hypothetical protein
MRENRLSGSEGGEGVNPLSPTLFLMRHVRGLKDEIAKARALRYQFPVSTRREAVPVRCCVTPRPRGTSFS